MANGMSNARPVLPVAAAVAGIWALVAARFVVLGADLMWAVALGDQIIDERALPLGVPFAVAPQAPWPNPVVLGELLLSVVNAIGPAALAGLGVGIVAGVLALTYLEAIRLCATDARAALALTLLVVGGATTFAVMRMPNLSLVPFALAVALMRRHDRAPSNRIWWAVPLFLVWGNVHGGVLVGLAVLAVFVLAAPPWDRLRRFGVGLVSLLAALMTPAKLDILAYYRGALDNEAAARGSQLWSAPDLTRPLDLVMVLAASVLLILAARHLRPWEMVVAVGLVVGTIMAARNGIWLLIFIAPVAGVVRMPPAANGPPGWWRVATVVGLVGVAGGGAAIVTSRGDAAYAPGSQDVATVAQAAHGRAVLADEPLAETLAQQGVTVWASNPLDAFPRVVQVQFLDFLEDGAIPPHTKVVVAAVTPDHAPHLEHQGWSRVVETGTTVVLER